VSIISRESADNAVGNFFFNFSALRLTTFLGGPTDPVIQYSPLPASSLHLIQTLESISHRRSERSGTDPTARDCRGQFTPLASPVDSFMGRSSHSRVGPPPDNVLVSVLPCTPRLNRSSSFKTHTRTCNSFNLGEFMTVHPTSPYPIMSGNGTNLGSLISALSLTCNLQCDT